MTDVPSRRSRNPLRPCPQSARDDFGAEAATLRRPERAERASGPRSAGDLTAFRRTEPKTNGPVASLARHAADLIDSELLRAWRGGDQRAGSELLQRHFGTLLAHLRSQHAFDTMELHEITQATMLACVESRERVPEGVAFRVYLLGIVRRIVADAYRASYRRRTRDAAPWPQASAQCPSEVAVALQERRRLARALPLLPEELQVVLRLHYWERMRTQDIAVECNIPKGTVKSRLRRARERLRDAMHAPR